MTTEEIKKNAPIGATHYDTYENEYMRYDGCGDFKYWDGEKWMHAIIDIDYIILNLKPL